MTRLTDNDRFRLPYRDAKDTLKPGYLRERFKRYAELQAEADRLEREAKVQQLPARKVVR